MKKISLIVIMVLCGLNSVEQVLSPEELQTRLTTIQKLLDQDQGAKAIAAAHTLAAFRWRQGSSELHVDPQFGTVKQAERLRILVRDLNAALHRPLQETAGVDTGLIKRLEQNRQNVSLPHDDFGVGLPSAGPWDALVETAEKICKNIGGLISSFLRWILGDTKKSIKEGFPAGTIAIVLVTGLAVITGLFIAIMFWHRRHRPIAMSPVSRTGIDADADPTSRSVQEWELRAEELARQGLRREAIRAAFHAALVAGFQNGVLHHDAGSTNWEYLARLHTNADVRDCFADLVRTFDQAWYGFHEGGDETWNRVVRQTRQFISGVSARGAA